MTKVVAKRGECWQFNQPVVSATALPNIYSQHKQLLAGLEQLLHQQTNSNAEQLIYRQFIFAELLSKIKADQLNYILIRKPYNIMLTKITKTKAIPEKEAGFIPKLKDNF